MDWLKGHFAWQSVRPHHAFYSGEVIPAAVFSEPDRVFDKLTSLNRTPWATIMWQSAGNRLDPLQVMAPDGLTVECATVRGCEAAVIQMPEPLSRNEVSFVVVARSSEKRLLGEKHKYRVFQVFDSFSKPGIIDIFELIPEQDSFQPSPQGHFEDVDTTPESLTDLVRNL